MASDKCEKQDLVASKVDNIENNTKDGVTIGDNAAKTNPESNSGLRSSSEVTGNSEEVEVKKDHDESPQEETTNKTNEQVTVEDQESKNSDTKQDDKSIAKENVGKKEPSLEQGLMDPVWDNCILAVRGILPVDLGAFKKLLVDLLGISRHRIRPRMKDDDSVYVHFKSVDDMKAAQKSLHNQTFCGKKITANISRYQQQTPGSSKKNTSQKLGSWFNFVDETYDKQIKVKMADLQSKMEYLDKTIGKVYPMYSAILNKRRLECNGMLCPIEPMKTFPPDKRNLPTVYRLTIGMSEVGQYGVGFFGKKLKGISASNLSCPEHIIEAAEVFEKMLQVPVEPTSIFSRWKKLIIHSNRAKDLMVTVFGKCPKDLETEELKRSCEVLKEFYTNGEGKECKIASLHMKIVRDEIVMGVPYIEETVDDLVVPLLPTIQLWNYVEGAKVLCSTIDTLLGLGKESTVLAVGCSILIGLHLAKVSGKVMMNLMPSTVMAEKYAAKNDITNCEHFDCDWGSDISFEDFADKIKHKDFCAVFNLTLKSYSPSSTIMNHLRKMEQLKKILMIEMNTTAAVTFPLIVPSVGSEINDPFFPSRIVPLDLLPNSKTYVKLTLFERIPHTELLENVVADPKNVSLGEKNPFKRMGTGQLVTPPKKQKKVPFNKEKVFGKFGSTSKKTAFKKPYDRQYSQSQGGWRDQRQVNVWNQSQDNMFQNQFQMTRQIHDPWNFPSIDIREQEIMAQIQRRRLEEEEYRRREEQYRQQMEEEMKQKLAEEIRSQLGRNEWRQYTGDEDRKTQEALRELERVKSELKEQVGMVRHLLKDQLREAAVPQLKEVIADAIKNAGLAGQEMRASDVVSSRTGAPEAQLTNVIAEAIKSAVSQEMRPGDGGATLRGAGNSHFQKHDSSHMNQKIGGVGDREYSLMEKDRQYQSNWKQSALNRDQEYLPPSLLSLKVNPPRDNSQPGDYLDRDYRNLPARDIDHRQNPIPFARGDQFHDQEIGGSSVKGQNYNLNYNRDVNVPRAFDNDSLRERVDRGYMAAGTRESESYERRDDVTDLYRQGDNRYMQGQNNQSLSTSRNYITYNQQGIETNKMFAPRGFDNNAKRMKLDDTLQDRFSGYASDSKKPSANKQGRYFGW